MVKGFGRIEKCRQQLEVRKDWLNELNQIVPWEEFRSILEELAPQEHKSNAGRKPFDIAQGTPIDPSLLFNLLILQQLYNLSDEDLEYQSHDQ